MTSIPQCLTIAGSDSGAGAGIQADLKTFAAHGIYGLSVVTAVTAQNTRGVFRSDAVSPEMVRAQLEVVFDDFDIAAVKIGMLASAETVAAVSAFWRSLKSPPPLVVDPVAASKNGHVLLDSRAMERLRSEILPFATVVTPNRQEAEMLSGVAIRSREDLKRAGERILELGPRAVLIKGGHLEGEGFDPAVAVDFLLAGGEWSEYSSERIESATTHGTGCTYSAAICANLARGLRLTSAIAEAKSYVTHAIQSGLSIGHGHGPLNHFYAIDRPAQEE